MSAIGVLIGAGLVFVFMRAFCEPKLRPGREIWDRVLGLEPKDANMLAGVRFLGTFSLMVALGAGGSTALTWWVESLDLTQMGSVPGQEAVDRVVGILAWFTVAEQALARLGMLVGVAYILLFGAGLLYWSARSTRNAGARVKVAIEELTERALANELPAMPNDERIERVDHAIAAARVGNIDGGVIEALLTRRFQYDLVRRLDPKLRWAVGDPVPGSRVGSVLRFLISAPLAGQVRRAGHVVWMFAMVTIVPASLAVTSADLGTAIDKKQPELEALAAALTLELELSARAPPPTSPTSQDVTDLLETEREEGPDHQEEQCDAGGVTLPPENCVAAEEFGEAFEAAWGASLLDRSGAVERATAEGIGNARRAWARRQILLETVAPRTATASVTEVATGSSQRQSWTHGVMDAELKARTGSGPVTGFGKLGREIFARWVRSEIGSVVVEKVDRPLTLRELVSPAVAAAVGWSVDGVGLAGTQPTLIEKLSSETLKEMLGQWAEEAVQRHPEGNRLRRSAELAAMSAASHVRDTKTAEGEPMRIDGETMRMVEAFVTRDLVQSYKDTIEWGTRLEFPKRTEEQSPPRVSLETPWSKGTDWNKVEHALRQYKTAAGGVPLDSLASYSSLFPGIQGQRARSQEARFARILDADWAKVSYGTPPEVPTGGVGGAGSVPGQGGGLQTLKATEITPVARDHLDRARSFMRLRGYLKVGGVLIGREPHAVSGNPDFVGFDFAFGETGTELTIHLTHADGTRTTVGPYDPVIAHLALAYAADGRPATVTIFPAFPLPDRKILLHPALVDTKVGCHAIRLDQFVGRFGLNGLVDTGRDAQIDRNMAALGLYRRALGTRWLGLLDQLDFDIKKSGASLPQEEKKRMEETRAIATMISQGSVVPDTLPSSIFETNALSALQQRPNLFDPELVGILGTCLTSVQNETSVSLAQCLDDRARRAGGNTREHPTHHWYGLPRLVPNSGVREVSYELDQDLEFAKVPRDIWDGPLRFVVLNSISMDWILNKAAELEFKDESEPWRFEQIQDVLQENVMNAVRIRPRAFQTMQVMQEFTVAQRLFRAAFAGQLGEQFPVEQLVALARKTADYVDFEAVSTDRWLLGGAVLRPPEGDALEAAKQLREALGVPPTQEITCLGDDPSQ